MHSDSRPPFFDRSWKPGRGLFYNGFRTGNPGGRIKTTPLPGRCRRVVTRWRAFRPQKRRFRGVFNVRKTTRWNRSIGRDSHNSVCPLKSLSPSPTAVRRPPKTCLVDCRFSPGTTSAGKRPLGNRTSRRTENIRTTGYVEKIRIVIGVVKKAAGRFSDRTGFGRESNGGNKNRVLPPTTRGDILARFN